MADPARAHVIVIGRVQGVFFRASTRETALELGLAGYVRNLPDGSVEAVFEGPIAAVEQAVTWSRTGPPHAAVEHVEVEWGQPEGLRGFSTPY